MELNKKTRIASLLCLFPGAFLLVSGILLLFASQAASALYGMQDMVLMQSPIAQGMGIRQFAIGLAITVLALGRQPKSLAYVMLIGALVPLADFFIFGPAIGWASSLRHAGPVPLILVFGIYLFIQTRKKPVSE